MIDRKGLLYILKADIAESISDLLVELFAVGHDEDGRISETHFLRFELARNIDHRDGFPASLRMPNHAPFFRFELLDDAIGGA